MEVRTDYAPPTHETVGNIITNGGICGGGESKTKRITERSIEAIGWIGDHSLNIVHPKSRKSG